MKNTNLTQIENAKNISLAALAEQRKKIMDENKNPKAISEWNNILTSINQDTRKDQEGNDKLDEIVKYTPTIVK